MSTPLPDSALPFDEQDECVLLAICIWGEARNQSMQGKLGVACVVRNRALHGGYGFGYRGVILKPWQFSSFNLDDPNRGKLLNPTGHEPAEVWESCYTAAYLVRNGSPDVTDGAVFYFSPPLTKPLYSIRYGVDIRKALQDCERWIKSKTEKQTK